MSRSGKVYSMPSLISRGKPRQPGKQVFGDGLTSCALPCLLPQVRGQSIVLCLGFDLSRNLYTGTLLYNQKSAGNLRIERRKQTIAPIVPVVDLFMILLLTHLSLETEACC
jgi:hypothetical protein